MKRLLQNLQQPLGHGAIRIDERLENNNAKQILKVIGEYSKALYLLDDYDHRTLKKIEGKTDERKIEYTECIYVINKLRFNEESSLFGVERDKGLESIIGNIYQSFAGQDIYKSIEEKGLLKRIGADKNGY